MTNPGAPTTPASAMTPMQARQLQIDEWMNRHHFHYVLTPATRAAATGKAIEADHAEALEMDANGDSGLAACLGIDSRGRVVTTPGSVADTIVTALTAQGGRVVQRVADRRWSNGFVVVDMPDGASVRISIDLD